MRRFLRDSFVRSMQTPSQFEDVLGKQNFLKEGMPESIIKKNNDEDILQILYMAKKSAPLGDQQWNFTEPYVFPQSSVDILTQEETNKLTDMYKVLYPGLQHTVIPMSCQRCNVLYLGNEVFGSWNSRYTRSSYIMAYWNSVGGQIIAETGTGDLAPGIVQKYIIHNLIVNGESRIHFLAKVHWLSPLASRYRHYCGSPVEAWDNTVFEAFGPSAFMPVQRIYCRYLTAERLVLGKHVTFICPLNKGLNI